MIAGNHSRSRLARTDDEESGFAVDSRAKARSLRSCQFPWIDVSCLGHVELVGRVKPNGGVPTIGPTS